MLLANEQILLTVGSINGEERGRGGRRRRGRGKKLLAEIEQPVENVGGSFGVAISRPEVSSSHSLFMRASRVSFPIPST